MNNVSIERSSTYFVKTSNAHMVYKLLESGVCPHVKRKRKHQEPRVFKIFISMLHIRMEKQQKSHNDINSCCLFPIYHVPSALYAVSYLILQTILRAELKFSRDPAELPKCFFTGQHVFTALRPLSDSALPLHAHNTLFTLSSSLGTSRTVPGLMH